jgi:RNA polymerase sigma factor (sigma-70 family)
MAPLRGGLRLALTGCPESLRAPPALALTFRGGRDPDRPPRKGPDHTEPRRPAVAPSPERQREIADFFAAHERDVCRSVAYRVRHLPIATIEDACQTAWEKLSRRPDVDLRRTGRGWLVTVAVHEAFEHYRRERVETPAGSFRAPDAESVGPGELREPAADDRDVAAQVADNLLHARRLSDLRTIKIQDRQALYLKGLGFRYHEIAALLSITYTAVNRRITEGRRRLRELEAARDVAS